MAKIGGIMQAFRILRHAFLMVARHPRQAVTISLVPTLIQTAAFAIFITVLPKMVANSTGAGRFWLLATTLGLVIGFCTIWIAVGWHRFVLLGEEPRFIPARRARSILNYAKTAVITAVFLSLALIPLAMAIFALMLIVNRDALPTAAILLGFLGNFLFCILLLRLGVALPGAALGDRTPIARSWAATGGKTSTLAMITLPYMLMQYGLQQLPFAEHNHAFIQQSWPWLGAQLMVYWLLWMFALSLLTTLWGHYVEGRALT
ncbi:hypothetical protein [Paracoccus sp. KR1-242]|uniref:hypothetical protein n=1 Tax=Paracoccus sp. KR1-242 TaxID=3410028 RepID=UPI003BFE538D